MSETQEGHAQPCTEGPKGGTQVFMPKTCRRVNRKPLRESRARRIGLFSSYAVYTPDLQPANATLTLAGEVLLSVGLSEAGRRGLLGCITEPIVIRSGDTPVGPTRSHYCEPELGTCLNQQGPSTLVSASGYDNENPDCPSSNTHNNSWPTSSSARATNTGGNCSKSCSHASLEYLGGCSSDIGKTSSSSDWSEEMGDARLKHPVSPSTSLSPAVSHQSAPQTPRPAGIGPPSSPTMQRPAQGNYSTATTAAKSTAPYSAVPAALHQYAQLPYYHFPPLLPPTSGPLVGCPPLACCMQALPQPLAGCHPQYMPFYPIMYPLFPVVTPYPGWPAVYPCAPAL
jgi:hypothetical protein